MKPVEQIIHGKRNKKLKLFNGFLFGWIDLSLFLFV